MKAQFLYQIHGDKYLIDYNNNFAHKLRILSTKIVMFHPGFGVLLCVFDKKTVIRQRDSKDISKRQPTESKTEY